MLNDELLTVEEVAQLLGLGSKTIQNWVKKQLIESKKNAPGHDRIPRREVDRLLEIAVEKQDISQQIIELYQSGMTLEDVGKKFGMTRQGVRDRLVRAGVPRRERDKYKVFRENITKARLEKLYLDDKLSIPKIAAEFSVNEAVIEQMLKVYQIPKRQPIEKGGYIVDILRDLKIDEKDSIELIKKGSYGFIYTIARCIGIRVSIRNRGVNKLEITRIG